MADIKRIMDPHTGEYKYYDFSPKNESFMQTAMELKALGIKNYYFMLEVKYPNSGVCDIDPFKKNITRHEIEILMRELQSNIWFYARTVARIQSDKGTVDFCLHRGLAALIWCFAKRFDSCLCEPRQTYKTTGSISTIVSWCFQLASQNANINFFGKDTDNTKKNLRDLKNDIDVLPEWLQFKRFIDNDGKTKKTRQATEILENKVRGNRIVMHPKPTSMSHAQGMARGDSMSIVYFDEIEHTPYFDVLLSNSAPAFKTASENAAIAGRPYGRIFTTTPGNLDTREGATAAPIIKSMVPWTERIYDMSDAEIEDYISAYRDEYHQDDTTDKSREVTRIFYIEYQYWQLRKTHKWVEEQYNLSGDKMAIRREILMQRLRGSTDSPIEPEDLEFLISHMQKSTTDIILNKKWRMLTYPHEQNTKLLLDSNIPYLIGVDPSGGGGGDNTSITIVNPYNLQIAAEFKSPYISGTELLRVLIDLIINYIPKGVLIPERNSMGIYLIHAICESSIKDNLYWSDSLQQLEDMANESESDYELKKLSQQYKKYGTYTSKKVRDAMFELLFNHIKECKQILNTEYLVDDMCKLIRTSTGKIQAAKGEHDDCVMSYNHAIYVYYTGDNLEFFGIRKTDHPIYGALEPNYEQNVEIKSGGNIEFFSSDNVTFEEIVISTTIEMEQMQKYAVAVNSNIYDPIYSNRPNSNNIFDDSVDIPPSFFDQINMF
jgi:hypothetical protein